jgi:dipeptidase E
MPARHGSPSLRNASCLPLAEIYTRPVASRILAMGGHSPLLEDAILELAGRRVCLVPTASGDVEWQLVRFYESFAPRAEPSHVSFDPWPRADLREHVLAQDAVYVSGGNTANALAVWRVHGFDRVLHEAWERGVLLCGWSAGMICWFEAGVTDSFGPQLEGMRDGLGFLPGSACPHYDGEERRRPVYEELVANGFPPGYAADDGVGLHFVGTQLHEVVSSRPDTGAYRVEAGSETPIAARLLG